MMTNAEMLSRLGVSPGVLTPDELATLDEFGFLRLENMLTSAQVDAINARLEELLMAEGNAAGTEGQTETGTERLADLINKGAMFEPMIAAPRVLTAVAHVLDGDVKLSTVNSRSSLPGQGMQALHQDWSQGQTMVGTYQVCNSIWLLDDFTAENGATRLVPGSHKLRQDPAKALKDSLAPHPMEVQALGRAGDVVVFNSHTWHSGTLNRSPQTRRSITAYYCRRHVKQYTDQRKYLRPETRAKFDEAVLMLMDVL